MPTVLPLQPPPQVAPQGAPHVTGAIQHAAAATGVDFRYLVAQAKLESGLDPAARARTSSAAGLYQFINDTWLETVDRHGADHGMGWAEQAITRHGGRAAIGDPALRAQVLALRHDPTAASLMAAELTRDNIAELQAFLGRAPDHAETYLAHFMGLSGAKDLLHAQQRDPGQIAATLFPEAAAANRAIFHDRGRARTVGEVMDVIRGKVAGAIEGGMPAATGTFARSAFSPPAFSPPAFSAPGAFTQAAAQFAEGVPARTSMAEVLQSTFGTGADMGTRAAARVSDAYGKFRTFDL